MRQVREYVRPDGSCPFELWFNALHAKAAARVVTAKARLQRGLGDVKPVGEGASELRIDFGPGYRVYFGSDGDTLIILLAGGSKKRQQDDIAFAKALWREYKERKKSAVHRTAERKGKR